MPPLGRVRNAQGSRGRISIAPERAISVAQLQPIGEYVNVPYPWEHLSSDFLRNGVVAPVAEAAVVRAHGRGREREAVQEYVRRIAPELPEEVRESFVRGAGMFDLPADDPDDGLDHLFD